MAGDAGGRRSLAGPGLPGRVVRGLRVQAGSVLQCRACGRALCELPVCIVPVLARRLPGTHFEGCGFTGDAKGCSFAFSDLQRAVFGACDLSLAVFDRTELFAIEMRECNLTGAKFTKVDFSRALRRSDVPAARRHGRIGTGAAAVTPVSRGAGELPVRFNNESRKKVDEWVGVDGQLSADHLVKYDDSRHDVRDPTSSCRANPGNNTRVQCR
jgi:hypothetical protein